MIRSTTRGLGRVMVLALFAFALTEACSLAASWILYREIFLLPPFYAEQAARIQEPIAGDEPSRPLPPEEENRADLNAAVISVHPYLGYVLNPRRARAQDVNPYGFRDEGNPFHARSAQTLVVANLGGSVAEKFFFSGTRTIAEELNHSAELRDREIVFVNGAMSGYKQPQQLMVLSYLLALGAEFDVIINIDGFNEIALSTANSMQAVFPFFPLHWQAWVAGLPDPLQAALAGEVVYLQGIRRHWAEAFVKQPWCYSVTLGLLWRLRDERLTRAIDAANQKLLAYRPGEHLYAATGPPRPYKDDSTMYEDFVAVWKRCSEQLHRSSEANRIRYFHFLQPNQYVPGSKQMQNEEARLAYDASSSYLPIVEKAYPLLSRAGRQLVQEGVRFHDLTMIFASTKEPVYSDACCHLNRRGTRLMAQTIAAAILEDFARQDGTGAREPSPP